MLILYIVIGAVILFADQLSKIWVCANAALGDTFASFGGLVDFTYVQNTGAAFSIMSGKMPVLSLISFVFCIAVIIYWIKKKPKNPLLCTAVVMMFSGALGNAIDRLLRGFVVDFIQLKFIAFPIFNIADIAITVGAVLLVLYVIIFSEDDKKNNEGNNN